MLNVHVAGYWLVVHFLLRVYHSGPIIITVPVFCQLKTLPVATHSLAGVMTAGLFRGIGYTDGSIFFLFHTR